MMKNSFLLVCTLAAFVACSSNKTESTTEAPTPEVTTNTLELPITVSASWNNTTAAYLRMKDAFVASDLASAKAAAIDITSAIAGADMSAMGDAHTAWMGVAPALSSKAAAVGQAPDIEAARTAFYALTEPMVAAVKVLGEGEQDLFVQYCPMAFDNAGANWIASEKKIRNPYFGDKMMNCGKVTEEL
jgi:Cu(I)/Ag(I) efflux system membrane fusion protein